MSPRSPLANSAFRAVWLASVFSFIGTWVQDVGESWTMLSMTPDPRFVAMLATCFLVPTMVLTLPAGLLADRADRRRLLILSESLSALAAAGPAIAIRLHHMSPVVLLACSGALGAAVAIGAPAWTTLVPELLPREKTAEAVTLGSIAFNIARVAGPAIGGVLLAATGAEITFIVNAVSFLAVVWVLWRYDEVKVASARPRETERAPLLHAFAEPFRESWRTPELRGAFLSSIAFGVSAMIIMAILPAFAKHALGASATGYGALLSSLGGGAILCGVFLVRVRSRLGPRMTVIVGMSVFGASVLFASRAAHVPGAMPFFLASGLGWIACFTTLSATVQLVAREATKSRVTALYQLAFYASAIVGASLGGAIAARWGERTAVAVGALGCLCAAGVTLRSFSIGAHVLAPDPAE
ncbi:MAG TPA: MFS transporter [Polyangiaceae bacterium]|jgi:MFS family permease